MTPLLQTEGLTRHYGGHTALDDVSIALEPGEILGIVGESGSGKSTLARLIMALDRPSAGRVLFEGADLFSQRPRDLRRMRRHFQMVFQDPYGALDPRQTVGRIVAEPLALDPDAPTGKARRMRVAALLEEVGLKDRDIDLYPHEFSGGQRQRIAIARALITRPKLLVADEPTSGLDPDRQDSVLEDLITNLPEGAACILVTHDMAQARAWCHRALVMLEGQVIEELPLPDGQPTHPYARMLFDPWGDHDLSQSTAM